MPLPAMPRGVYVVGPVTYEKTDPVGLVARRFATGTSVELLVAPRVTDLSLFAGGLTNDLDGATSQQLSMSDLAFHALREYVPGDDLRHVHWRSSAKAGELLVRQYHETRRGHVTVLVDGSPRRPTRAVGTSSSRSRWRPRSRCVQCATTSTPTCGAVPHVARGRSAVAMTDAACRFAAEGRTTTSRTPPTRPPPSPGTGLVVQVTGAARASSELDARRSSSTAAADWIVVRADSEGEADPCVTATHLRELSVPDLARLQDLLARGMR